MIPYTYEISLKDREIGLLPPLKDFKIGEQFGSGDFSVVDGKGDLFSGEVNNIEILAW